MQFQIKNGPMSQWYMSFRRAACDIRTFYSVTRAAGFGPGSALEC